MPPAGLGPYSAGQSAIDHQLGTGYISGLGRSQEERGVSYIPGIAHLAGGAELVAHFHHLLYIALGIGLCEGMCDHRRFHKAGQNGVGADLLPGVLQGDALGELVDGSLGGTVGHIRHAEPADPGHRRNIDDGASALAFHMRQHVLTGQKNALEIDLVDPIPALLAGLDAPTDFENPDIVVQDIDPAIGRQAGLHHRRHIDTLTDIGLACSTLVALPLPQPGPTEPAPVTIATWSGRR